MIGWMKWRNVVGVLCDMNIPSKVIGIASATANMNDILSVLDDKCFDVDQDLFYYIKRRVIFLVS